MGLVGLALGIWRSFAVGRVDVGLGRRWEDVERGMEVVVGMGVVVADQVLEVPFLAQMGRLASCHNTLLASLVQQATRAS